MKSIRVLIFISLLSLPLSCGDGFNDPGESNRGNSGGSFEIEPCPVAGLRASTPQALFDCDGNKVPDTKANSTEVSWILPSHKETQHEWLSGVARVSSCTGSLVETGSDSSPAYVITNGHCINYAGGMPPSSGNIINVAYQAEVSFFRYFDFPDASLRPTYTTDLLLYASMDKTDVALLRLSGNVTLGDVKSEGVKAYKLANEKPKEGQKIETAGLPANYVSSVVLRHSICHAGKEVSLVEGPYKFPETHQMKCNVLGGSSGSPVFDYKTKEIIALVNTTVNDSSEGQEACSLNRPCEIVGETNSVNTQTNYMQSVAFLSPCFTEEGEFDKSHGNCELK